MTGSVTRIAKTETEPLSAGSPAGTATVFDASLKAEQADTLLRRTDQYAQWQRIRQKNETEAQRLADIFLHRETLLKEYAGGKSINWQDFDRLTAQLHQAGLTLPNSQDIQSQKNGSPASSAPATSPAQTEAAVPAAPADTLVNDENMLILSVTFPAIGLKQEIVGYGDQETTLLPLGGFAQALDFDLKVDAAKGNASGWFISEDRTFFLDAAQKKIRINGETVDWNESQIFVGEDDIYVDSRLLSQWFPVDVTISTGEMTAELKPREKLPIQLQYDREQKRKGLSGKEDMSLKYTPTQAPYELYSFPVMDVSLASGVEKNDRDNSELRMNHSVVAEGDLAHMGAKVFLSGDEEEPLDRARITLERLDPEAKLLGKMRASRITVGDVSPVTLPILGSSSIERGVSVANGEINRSRDFDTTRFEGNAQPGWDVELYQNGNLINSVRVGSDGRYLFEDIPVYFGPNAFQLLAHGPQGQRRMVETKNINVGSGMLKAGKVEYDFSATQRKNTVFGIDQEESSEGEGERLLAKFSYGLTDYLSATVGASTVEFDQTRHNYMQAGLSGTLSSFYGEMNAIEDSAGGSGYSVQGQTALGPINLRGKHEIFSDFIDEDTPDRILKDRTWFGLNGSSPKFTFLPVVSYTLSREDTTYKDGKTGRTSARVASYVKGVHLSNVLNWNDGETNTGSNAPMDGEFQASGSIGRGRITAGLGYDFGDESGITEYKLSSHWPISQGISVGGSLIQDVEDENKEVTRARVNLDFDNGKYTLSPSLTYDSEGNYGAFLGLSFSLGQDPVSEDMVLQSEKRSGRGATTALVYHDANNNKVFDQDETPLPEVRVVARQVRKNTRTNDSGVAQFTGLKASDPIDIEVDAETLKDPFMQPAVPGVAVVPRSGSVHTLEFPVVSTGEIDGGVYFVNPNGVKEPLAKVRLEIRDDKGQPVQTTISEYDGFYLFEKVFPGTYTLHAASEDPRLQALAAGWHKEIVIGNDGTIARGNDIILQETGTKNREKTNDILRSPLPSGSSREEMGAGNPVIAAVGSTSKPAASASIKPLKTSNKAGKEIPIAPAIAMASSTPPPAAAISSEGEPSAVFRPTSSISIAPLTVVQASQQASTTAKATTPHERSDESSENKEAMLPSAQPLVPGRQPLDRGMPAQAALANSQGVASSSAIRQLSSLVDSPVVKERPAVAKPEASAVGTAKNGQERLFAVHLASYKSMEAAQTGLQVLAKRLAGIVTAAELSVTKVDLGQEKGVYYRVTCGQFGKKADADRLAARMRPRTESAMSLPINYSAGESQPVASLPVRRLPPGPDPRIIAQKYAAMQRSKF